MPERFLRGPLAPRQNLIYELRLRNKLTIEPSSAKRGSWSEISVKSLEAVVRPMGTEVGGAGWRISSVAFHGFTVRESILPLA
jgi:hypothetical protein